MILKAPTAVSDGILGSFEDCSRSELGYALPRNAVKVGCTRDNTWFAVLRYTYLTRGGGNTSHSGAMHGEESCPVKAQGKWTLCMTYSVRWVLHVGLKRCIFDRYVAERCQGELDANYWEIVGYVGPVWTFCRFPNKRVPGIYR